MRLSISSSAASSLACIAAITRIFFGLMIDSSDLYNSAWLSVTLGTLLAFPLFLSLKRIIENMQFKEKAPITMRVSALIFMSYALFEGAVSLSGLSNSAAYIGFENISSVYLIIPIILIGFFCVCLNGDSLGSGARLWLKISPIFLLIILIIQLPYYKPEWLTPILGYGWKNILSGALKTAGWLSGMSGALLLATLEKGDNSSKLNPLKLLVFVSVSAVILIISQLMMSPSLIFSESRSRLYQLDTLLTNGRANLSIQFPMILLWFMSMAYLWSYEVFIAASMLQKALPMLDGRLCAIISLSAIIFLMPLSARRFESIISGWQFAINGSAVSIIMISILRRKRICEESH